jgi:hypothetical protein
VALLLLLLCSSPALTGGPVELKTLSGHLLQLPVGEDTVITPNSELVLQNQVCCAVSRCVVLCNVVPWCVVLSLYRRHFPVA